MDDTGEKTDEAIVRLVQQGDTEIFGLLMKRYEEKLLRYGRKFLSRSEDIEDIVQDVFLKAFRGIQSFNASLRFSPWIYRIAHNSFANELRRHSYAPIMMDFDTLLSYAIVDETQESERDQKEMRQLLERGLEKLDQKYREVLILYYFEEMPYKDIADVLEIPVGTVSIRVKRAKDALRHALNPRT